ncbi:MAG TPA: NADH-quinone oxidoreductase subunit N [Chloroflexi bacterium]|nr:NADH-quinone oxidoreductase subunit N [Chloroflexota bacterium]
MTLNQFGTDLLVLLPLTFLLGWASLLLLADLFIPAKNKGAMALLSALGLAVSLAMALVQKGPALAFGGTVALDGFSTFLNVLFLASGLVAVALAYDYLKHMRLERNTYYILLLFSVGGMMLMGMSTDLMMVFLSLELLSIPLYVLSGFARPAEKSEEAAIKYFLLGAFASGFVVYGIALVFGATGTTSLAGIVQAVKSGALLNPNLLTIGGALLLIGLGFKVAAVPFHMWTPDVYHGAPTSVTAFMALGAKAAGFAALLRIFLTVFPSLAADFTPVLWVLAALTMFLGNVVAIAQRNIKRMLAYSSIAHAGYLLMALVPYGQRGLTGDVSASLLFYLVAYGLTNFGVWSVVMLLERAEGKGLALDDYAGLGRKYPALAASMTVFMLSFAGVPPTLGFVGKFYLFRTVLEGGYIWLALIGVLTSLVSAYYYLRVVVIMYMRDGEPEVASAPWLKAAAWVTAAGLVIFTFASGALFTWASQALLTAF